MHNDIVIIGGGIIGMLSAHELSAAGARVTIVDQDGWGQESSWAGGGILSPLYPWRYSQAVNDLARWSQHHYPPLCAALHANTGIDAQWSPCGLLVLDQDDKDAAQQWAADYPMPLELIPPGGDPRFRCERASMNQSTLWFPSIAHVRNPRLLQALHQDLEASDVTFHLRRQVHSFEIADDRVTAAITTAGPVTGDRFLICTGAWTGGLAKTLALDLPITPVKGQMILFDAAPDVVPCMVLSKAHYLIPRRDGKILVGSTLEHASFDKTITSNARQELHDFALSLYPALAQYPIIQHWAGLRPGTPEGIPIIDRHPRLKNTYINAGHFRNGVVLAPASSRLMCNMILDQPLLLDPTPYKIQ